MYKVFLSSTSRDLKSYREAVHRALDGMPGFALVKMEDFGARDANAKDLCARVVRESDLLVGLIGHYYGSCPPNHATSYTELEYRTAKDADLPRLMFAAPDDFSCPISLRESDASFERQQALRREVMSERVVASFDTPEQLAAAVTKALFVWHEEQRQAEESTASGLDEAPVHFVAAAEAERALGPNPYRGLEAFRKEDAARFFGREALVEKLWEAFIALHGNAMDGKASVRLLAIIGPSGCGKSSVAQAGLLAALDERPLPGRPAAPSVVLTPEAKPLESLAVALARLATGDPAPAQKALEFEQALRERPEADGLRFLAAQMLGKAGVVLLVDQFEETYALCEDEAQRRAFIDNLLNAARDPNGRVSIVLTLRSDFLGAVNQHPELSGLIARQNVVVPVMGEDELRRAIEQPAKAAGQEIDASTVDLLIEQTLGREGALPALEFVLTRISEGIRKGISSADTVRELGGVGGALAREARRIYQSLSDGQKVVTRRAFLAMTMLGEGTKDTRRRAPIEEMVAAGQSEADVRRVLEIFADPDRRLITLAADKDGKTIAEVAHEALFDHWSELKQWLDQDRDKIRFARRLEGAVREWIDSGRSKGMLWRPPLLDLLRAYAKDRAGDMPAGQLAFFEASESQRRRGVWTRRAGIAAAIAGLLIIAGGLILYSRQQADFAQLQAELRQEAEAAKSEAVLQAQAAKNEKERADAQRDEALKTQSLFLAELSEQETKVGKATNGILLALEALPNEIDRPERPYVVEAEAALYGAMLKHRESRVLEGRGDPVYSAAFSADGTRVVTASADGTARLWDASSGKVPATLEGHGGPVGGATFSTDGMRVVTASADLTARLWDAATGEALATLGGHGGPVGWATFSADGKRVATASADGTARLWDAASGQVLAVLYGHQGAVRSAAFSIDGTRVVTASFDNTARLWDAVSGDVLATLEGHKGAVGSATFSADGSRVVTASFDKTARLWDPASGKLLFTLEGHRGPVYSAAFSADGTRVVTASADLTARLWDAASSEAIATLEGHTGAVYSAAFSADGTRVVTASDDGTARVWDATSGKALAALEGHQGAVGSVAFSADGMRVVTASADLTARIWDAVSGETLATLEGHAGPVGSAAFSADGTRVVTASADGTARLWDASPGTAPATLEGHRGPVYSAAFSADGTRVVTASFDNTARLWDAASGEAIITLEGHRGPVGRATFSADDARVVTASDDGTARLWDAASGKALFTLEGHRGPVYSAAFSADGTRVVTACADGTARLWDAVSGEVLATLEGHRGPVRSAAFSANDTRIVTAYDDGTAGLWDAASGKALFTLEGHKGPVYSAAFSPDGMRVVTASADFTARLWDAATGEALATLEGHRGAVGRATFSADGKRVATASADGTARIWRVFPNTQELIDYARSMVPRQLTPEQRRQFFLEAE